MIWRPCDVTPLCPPLHCEGHTPQQLGDRAPVGSRELMENAVTTFSFHNQLRHFLSRRGEGTMGRDRSGIARLTAGSIVTAINECV